MKIKPYLNKRNIPNIIAFALSYLLYFVVLFLTIRYSKLSPIPYFLIFGIVFVIILLFGIISLEGMLERKPKLLNISLAFLSVISIVSIVIIFFIFRINSSINNVIVDPNQNTEISTAFVVYDTNKYANEKDLSGLKMGVLSNSDTSDRNGFVKNQVETLSLNMNFIEYLSYNDMLLGLFDGEINVAALPSDYFNQFSDYEGYLEYLERTQIVYEFKSSVVNNNETVDVDVTKEPFSVLIMGNDGGRTDSLILATYNPLKLSVTMTSIPRDSFVPIACYPNQQKDKIGHAFSVSRECALETVENLFEIDINYFIEVNFKGVVEIVDALDRVWLESPVEFVGQNSDEDRGHYTVWIPKGGFWATGEMALALARERYHMPGGDYQRQENQQQVIQAIIDRTLQLKDINKALGVLDAAGNNVKTNMSLDQMIDIFNVLINAINKTSIEPAYILDIVGSRVMGYSSYTYNDSLQLPLWISKPYAGSIEDVRKLMVSNLELSNMPDFFKSEFDARQIFYQEDYFSKVYDEKQEHERLPDFMPTMANNNWTIVEARKWASERGIALSIEEIRSGNSLYNANVVHNYVVGQSVKYGVKTSNFNKLSIKVIKHELDCSLESNLQYEECKYRLPDFQDNGGNLTTVSSVIAWFKDLGLNVKVNYVLIPDSDPTYNKTKIGYVIRQSPTTWDDVRSLSEITLTVMDPNFSIAIPDTTQWTVQIARDWVKSNLSKEENIVLKYEPTLDVNLVGKVKSTNPVTGQKIKYESILNVTAYGEGYVMPNLINKTKEQVQNEFCNLGIAICSFVDVETSDSSSVGKVVSQDIAPDSVKLKSELSKTTIVFGVNKLVVPTTTP